MITPDEYGKLHNAEQQKHKEQQERIEAFIDSRIKANQLAFQVPRSEWLTENINEVLSKYRAYGWICSFENGKGFTFRMAESK